MEPKCIWIRINILFFCQKIEQTGSNWDQSPYTVAHLFLLFVFEDKQKNPSYISFFSPNKFLFLTEEAYSHSGLQTRRLGQTNFKKVPTKFIWNSCCIRSSRVEVNFKTAKSDGFYKPNKQNTWTTSKGLWSNFDRSPVCSWLLSTFRGTLFVWCHDNRPSCRCLIEFPRLLRIMIVS